MMSGLQIRNLKDGLLQKEVDVSKNWKKVLKKQRKSILGKNKYKIKYKGILNKEQN